ncbi:uL15 family ribosomal protein [Candidatus Woesearchaeota archaeon]|nr:uL15 family ribosomal protein [Candidatus Woesearchaeota archaeon]
MTATHRRKKTKLRGNTTHGYGSRKKHRGAGNRGGRGMAGTGKRADHKRKMVLKYYGREYWGKKGFGIPNKLRDDIRAINIKDLPDKDEVNLTEQGYDKLLGTGEPRRKYKITVKSCSERAKIKIEKAGGSLVTG